MSTGAQTQRIESPWAARLGGAVRVLEDPDHHVWCCAPIWGDDGKVHVFFSRWPSRVGHDGWLWCCEVAHAVADEPTGPYEVRDVALRPGGEGHWDGATIHNPTIHRVDGRYALFYLGAAAVPSGDWRDRVASQRIGLAVADDLSGPWRRLDAPVVDVGEPGDWDDMLTSNPAFILTPSGEHRLYYKSMRRRDYDAGRCARRKYGLAVADRVDGPYRKHPSNPLVDVSDLGPNAEFEDAYVWREAGRYHMLARDMGVFGPDHGLYFDSDDGITWSRPQIGYLPAAHYLDEPGAAGNPLARFERPQLLFTDGRPTHLFAACRGGRGGTSSGVVFAITDS